MPADGRGRPRQIDVVRIRIAWKTLDVVCVSKRVVAFGRSVAPHAVESESGIGIGIWRIVIVDTLSVPDLGPIPAVLRSFAVFDHDGPAVNSFRRLELVSRCGRGILFLYDHCTVRDGRFGIVCYKPIDYIRGVIDFDGGVYAVADAVNEWTSVTKRFVFTPLQRSVFSAGEKRFELGLKLRESRRKEGAGQR